MLGSFSNAGLLADNRDRFLMLLPVCCYIKKIHAQICRKKACHTGVAEEKYTNPNDLSPGCY